MTTFRTDQLAHDAVVTVPAWYAVWTRSHCERLVAQQLAAKGFSPFLPEMSLRSTRRGMSKGGHDGRSVRLQPDQMLVRVPMFPGYLFVHQALDKERYLQMLNVRGIVRVLEDGWTRLTPIPDAEIDAIQRIVDAHVPVFEHPHLTQGDRVRIVEGALSGLEGIFLHDRGTKGRFVLSIHLLGRSVAVEVDCEAVVPSSPRIAA